MFIAVTVGTGYAIHTATQQAMIALVDKRIAAESEVVVAAVPEGRAAVIARITELTGARETGDIGIELTDRAGRHVAGNIWLRQRLPQGLATLDAASRIKGLSHGRALVLEIGDGLRLTTIAETEPIDDYFAARTRIYLIGFGCIIVMVIAASIVLGLTIRRRINALNETAEAIIDGDMRSRVPVTGATSAFDRQGRVFNRMLDRIGELMAGLDNISNDIAHDLRTPLARLRNQLTRIEQHADSPEMRDEVEAAIAQSDLILEMFAAVLRIVEVEGGDRRAAFEPLDLGALAGDAAEMLVPVAEETGHLLEIAQGAVVPIIGDRQLLTQAVINLIENALRHTPPGSRIAVSVATEDGEAVLAVTDNGPGIPAEAHQRALRRFGRIDKSRNRPGHGLGLPLVDAIARLHRGTLELADAGPGLRVMVRVPMLPAEPPQSR